MTSLIPSGVDDLLCLPSRLHIVIAARDPIALAALRTSVGDTTDAYRHQARRLEQANYITIHQNWRESPSLILKTTALGRQRLTHHLAALHALARDLGMEEPMSAAIPRRRAKR